MEEFQQKSEKPKKTFWTGVTWPVGMGLIGFVIGTVVSLGEGDTGILGGAIGAGVGFVIQKIIKK